MYCFIFTGYFAFTVGQLMDNVLLTPNLNKVLSILPTAKFS